MERGGILASVLLFQKAEIFAMRTKKTVFVLTTLLLGAFLLLPASAAQARGFRSRIFVGGGWGWGWGWGWGYPAYGYPYAYPGYGYAYGPAIFARVKTDVEPEEARLYLDGRLIGTADDFDGYPDYLYLKRGHYRLEFRLDGYESKTIEVDSEPGLTLRINNTLKKIPGAKRHGSYEEPRIEGGIQRFWGKRHDRTAAIDPSSPDSRYADSDEDSISAPRRDSNGEIDRGRPVNQDWRENRRGSSAPSAPRRQTAERSRLSIAVSPGDAAVYLDDRFIGTAEELGSLQNGLAVSAGTHTVTASRPGFRDQSVDVDVAAGDSEKVEISLSR
jgi:PEGA domain-containing protein